MSFPKLDERVWVIAAAGAAILIGGALWPLLRGSADPEDAERRRRARVNRIGRIAEGRVLDILEMPASPAQVRGISRLTRPKPALVPADQRKLVCYSYSISGVSYETAQDITGLAARAGLDQFAAGKPASIKYDPVNPSNSIVVADDWSGVQ